MGISQIEEISKNLLKNQVSLKENVSIIKNASLINQKIYKTNLKECSSFIKKNNIYPHLPSLSSDKWTYIK